MAKLTIGFGIILVLLAVIGFVATGSSHPTALIPAILGLLFVLFGALANTTDSKKRMLWMHIAVTVGLLGFLSMIPADIAVYRLSKGAQYPYPAAIIEKAAMSLLCLLYVLFCIRSFINARLQKS
jgi:fucose 4-O-acetylase-like acetyltransferase